MEEKEIKLFALDLNQQGVALLKAGNIDKAKEKFKQAIEVNPMIADSYKNMGDLYMSLEDYTNAKNLYKKAMLIEKNGVLYFSYGNACFMNDELGEGIKYYNLAVAEGYDNEDMLFFMGLAYEALNNDDMALRFFKKAYSKNPMRTEYSVKIIEVLFRLGLYDNAEEYNNRLLQENPEMFDGYHIKTQILLHDDKYEEAVAFAKNASEKFPEDAELLFDYAKAVSLNGELDKALKILEEAKNMKYFEVAKRDVNMLESQIYAEKGEIDKAIECCNVCIELEDDSIFDSEAHFMIMNYYIAKKDFENVIKHANMLIAKDDNDIFYYAALYYRAFCYKEMGNKEESNRYYKEAASLYRLETLKNPEAIDVYLYRAMCHRDMEEYDEALNILDFISGLSTQIAEEHLIRADIYALQGRKSLEKEERNKAFKLKPTLKTDMDNEVE